MVPGHETSSFFPVESLFQTSTCTDNSRPSVSYVVPQDFPGGVVMKRVRRSRSYSGDRVVHHVDTSDQEMQAEDEVVWEDGPLGEKKKRLTVEQVKALEKSFELSNKLDPERKIQLARALNLHPRQVAIWFQNRRARWKTKNMEKSYELLKMQLEVLQADNEVLRAQNKQYHAELMALTRNSGGGGGLGQFNLNNIVNEASWSNGSDNSAGHLNLGFNPGMGNGLNHVFSSGMMAQPVAGVPQFVQSSMRVADQPPASFMDGSFANLLSSLEDQTGFWTWPENPTFN